MEQKYKSRDCRKFIQTLFYLVPPSENIVERPLGYILFIRYPHEWQRDADYEQIRMKISSRLLSPALIWIPYCKML